MRLGCPGIVDREGADRRVSRGRGHRGRDPGDDRLRVAGLYRRRAAGQGGRRVARAGARGARLAGPRAAAETDHAVNLAPADVLKEGSHFDLPIALALLAAMEALPADELGGYMALGEVALDGSLTSVTGVLLEALAAASRGSGVICPAECGGEAAWTGEVEVIAAPSLLAIVNHFKGTKLLPPPEPRLPPSRSAGLDLADEGPGEHQAGARNRRRGRTQFADDRLGKDPRSGRPPMVLPGVGWSEGRKPAG